MYMLHSQPQLCVTLRETLNVLGPPFPHLSNGCGNSTCPLGLWFHELTHK